MSYDELAQQWRERRIQCDMIAERAQASGLDVDWRTVNRHYRTFLRWYTGNLATGYLIKRTGIKHRERK